MAIGAVGLLRRDIGHLRQPLRRRLSLDAVQHFAAEPLICTAFGDFEAEEPIDIGVDEFFIVTDGEWTNALCEGTGFSDYLIGPGVGDEDPGVKSEIDDWWDMLQSDLPSLVTYLQVQMQTRGLYKGEVNGIIDDETMRAVRAYKTTLGLADDLNLDGEFFRRYLAANHAELQPKAQERLKEIIELLDRMSKNTFEARERGRLARLAAEQQRSAS